MTNELTQNRPYTIVSLAAVAWDFPLVGRTRMLSECWQRGGQRTIFVEAPHSWRSGLKSLLPSTSAIPVSTLRPRASYPVRFWGRLGEKRIRKDMIRRAHRLRRRLDEMVNWESAVGLVVSPAWAPWLDELPFSTVIYDCIDHLAVHAPYAGLLPLFRAWEGELIGRANGAMVTAQILADHVGAIRPDLPVTLIRNGVDVERFEKAQTYQRPTDLPRPSPLIGFVGALYEWIDWELIEGCARAAPQAMFIFIGPSNQPDVIRRLAALPNVKFLGPRAYPKVPNYLAAFDLCWVPFKAIAVSAAANPIKIYEYLAAGKPVISTPVADLDEFGELVRVISNAHDFVAALAELLPDAPDMTNRRRQFATTNNWSRRANDVVEFIRSVRSGAPRAIHA